LAVIYFGGVLLTGFQKVLLSHVSGALSVLCLPGEENKSWLCLRNKERCLVSLEDEEEINKKRKRMSDEDAVLVLQPLFQVQVRSKIKERKQQSELLRDNMTMPDTLCSPA
jgi:hypothetical protein